MADRPSQRWYTANVAAVALAAMTSLCSTASGDDALPATEIPLVSGGSVSLEQFADDEPVLLKFWATWCVECLRQMPAYRTLYRDYGDEIRFLAVNVAVSDPVDVVRKAVAEHRLDMPVAYDASGYLWQTFDVRGTPTYVLLDSSGAVSYSGYRHDDDLRRALATVARLPVPRRPESPSIDRPPTNLSDIDGNPVDTGDGESAPRLFYHFATWCETYLQQTNTELAARCEQFRLAVDQLDEVKIVGFATRYSTTRESVRDYQEQHEISHPLVFDADGAFGRLFGVRDFPYAIVVRDGVAIHASDRIDVKVLTALGEASEAEE